MESAVTVAAVWLGVSSAALILFCCAGYLLRMVSKRLDGAAGKRARRVMKFTKKHHRGAGIAAIVLMVAHFLANAAVVHRMSSLGVLLGVALLLLARNGFSRERDNRLHVHRTLAALAAALLALHVVSQATM